ncbi:MAG TPA: hypothetical protein VJ867_12215 [Gemmatimonadaceae bacterium]|nr:hypothetical protein [Gemmatimonadaceae bacterium]
MKFTRVLRGVAAAGAAFLAACNSLDIENPNAPDNQKLLADPNAIESIAGGTLRSWYNAYEGVEATGPLTTMARTYSASWNNAQMRFYSSIDNPGTPVLNASGGTSGYTPTATWHRGNGAEPFGTWQNDPNSAQRFQVEWFWSGGGNEWGTPGGYPGFYAGMSSANDVLKAIRQNGLVIGDANQTKRDEIIAMLGRALAYQGLAVNYDSAYAIDENTKLDTLDAFSNRKYMRDAAVAEFKAVADSAAKYTFTTDAGWMNGHSYSNLQIVKLANTMAGMTLMYYPRDPSEVTSQLDAATLNTAIGYLSAGMDFDFVASGDGCVAWCPEQATWFQDIGGGRVSTRVSHLLDPATQTDPWPLQGNPRPNSADKRLGDGSYGNGDNDGSSRETPVRDAGGGSYFAWSPAAPFRPSRGQYHQSNIADVRYDASGNQEGNWVGVGVGDYPAVTAAQSDLLLAEALLRRGNVTDLGTVVTLINKTRVGKGGLPAATIADGVGAPSDGPCMSNGILARSEGSTNSPCSLWAKLLYEKEIEVLPMAASPFYEQRRLPWVATCGTTFPCTGRHVQGLVPGTPFEIPVPAKELQVQGKPLYTYSAANPKSATP